MAKGVQANWIHRGAPRPANPVRRHPAKSVWTRVRMIMTLDMDVTAERRHYNTHRPIGRYHNPQRRRRCRPLSGSEHNPPPTGGHNPRPGGPSTFPYEPSEPFEPGRRRRLNPHAAGVSTGKAPSTLTPEKACLPPVLKYSFFLLFFCYT